ncbi:MAG: DUF58 domain-containing protein [Planctomycetota bacterium]
MPDLLTPEFMHRLDRLDVASRKLLRGSMQGERRSKQKGQSVEFADYRPYVVGDDLRRIDWNLYARLDKLFLRLFLEEQDLSVTVLFDTTRSMDWPQNTATQPSKLLYAKQLAAALGYVALNQHNRLSVFAFADRLLGQLDGLRGKRSLPRLLQFLEDTPVSESPGDLSASLRQLALTQRRPGVVVVISDFLDKSAALSESLRFLAGPKFDALAVQVLSPEERDPAKASGGGIAGDLRLTDVEDGDVAEVSATSVLVGKYRETLRAYIESVRQSCVRRGVGFADVSTDLPVERLVLDTFRQRGWLK